MNDQRVTDKLMRIRSSVQLNYPKHEIVEQGYHGTSRLGVFFLILKCPTTHYYLSFMWRMQDRRVIEVSIQTCDMMRHNFGLKVCTATTNKFSKLWRYKWIWYPVSIRGWHN